MENQPTLHVAPREDPGVHKRQRRASDADPCHVDEPNTDANAGPQAGDGEGETSLHTVNSHTDSRNKTKRIDSAEVGRSTRRFLFSLPSCRCPQERKATCLIIQRAGARLKLTASCIHIATVFYHRGLDAWEKLEPLGQASEELAMISSEELAIACVYLAGKATEDTRKVRDVINVVHHMRTGSICVIDDAFWRLRRQILAVEQALLRAMDFETDVETPHRYLLNGCKTLRVSPRFVRLCWGLLVDAGDNPRVVLQRPEVHLTLTLTLTPILSFTPVWRRFFPCQVT